MRDNFERRISKAAGWARRCGAFSLVLLATVWIGHHFGMVETIGYLWVLGLVALLAACALLFAVFAFARLWSYGDRGGRDLTVGALLALLTLAPFGVAASWLTAYPSLSDVSTDLDDPPRLDVAGRTAEMNVPVPATPGEKRLQAQNYPLVTTHRYDLPFQDVLAAVEAVVARQGWRVEPMPTAVGQAQITVNAVASSFVLELPADVAIRVSDEGEAALVDMRSASRFGRHDLGDNAARIQRFLAELDQEVAGRIGPELAE